MTKEIKVIKVYVPKGVQVPDKSVAVTIDRRPLRVVRIPVTRTSAPPKKIKI